MAVRFQAPRGMQDLLPQEWRQLRQIEDLAIQLGRVYGFSPIETPIVEFTEVFHRGLGESSDMVAKETYTFIDRSGDSLTLRPEGTAGLVRALLSNGVLQDLPLKWMYLGPMFRHERPQKGRLRQFHQIGVEAIGYAEPWVDAEVMAFAQQFLQSLGLAGKFVLHVNSVGDAESRKAHRAKFVEFLSPYRKELSPDSQVRLEKNPLRIFDSKDPQDQKILQGAPTLKACLTPQAQKFFGEVLDTLSAWGIAFEQNQALVRGIDYYTQTVFEFVTDQLGSQGALLAGGRYDGLLEEFGGPSTPGVGWGAGIERLMMLAQLSAQSNLQAGTCVFVLEDNLLSRGLELVQQLRSAQIPCEFLGAGSPAKKLKRANKLGVRFACFIGGDEAQKNLVVVKDLLQGDQTLTHASEFVSTVRSGSSNRR